MSFEYIFDDNELKCVRAYPLKEANISGVSYYKLNKEFIIFDVPTGITITKGKSLSVAIEKYLTLEMKIINIRRSENYYTGYMRLQKLKNRKSEKVCENCLHYKKSEFSNIIKWCSKNREQPTPYRMKVGCNDFEDIHVVRLI